MNQKIEFRQVRDFGELVSDTFVFTRQNFKPLLKSVVYICGFFFIAYAITATFQATHLQEMIKEESITTMPLKAYGWEFLLSSVFSLAFYTAITVTVFSYISLYNEKGHEAPEVEEVWAYTKFYFWRMLGASIVLFALNAAAFMFCLVPGIYLWPITSLIIATILFENSTLGYGFNRGFKLIKDRWWITFGAIFIVIVIIVALSVVLALPASLLSAGSILFSTASQSTPLLIISTFLQSLAMIFTVLLNIVIALSYFSLVEAKDGTGLMDKVNMIGQNSQDSDLPEEQY